MRHFRVLWLRLALAAAVCLSVVSVAHADASLYTGSFPIATVGTTVWYPWSLQVGGSLMGDTQSINYSLSLSAPITNFQVTPPCGPGCEQYFTGNLNSGSLSFQGIGALGQDPYEFAANITPGGSIIGGVTCDSFGCTWVESVLIEFVGQPSHGLQSSGNLILDGASYGGGGGDSGFLNMVSTPVPEPNSILLFGSGILGLATVLRRRRSR
jgi:PEP-CTERM motif